MATKYDVLIALIEADHDRWGGDEMGLHHVIVGVVDEISTSHGSEEELADAIYDRIAGAYTPDKKKENASDENQVDQT